MPRDSISQGESCVSPLASHQGLSALEIIQDCLEKAKGMLPGLLECACPPAGLLLHQQLSLLDDLLDIALSACD